MFSDRLTNIIAFSLLALMFLMALFSMMGDSLTFDEKAHIGAGFSYLLKQDYRLNPEHPPLIKDLAAFPLIFLNLHFPDNISSWTQKDQAPPWWAQFDFGREFLYYSGNDPVKIIFWSRLMMILLVIFLGWLIFWWIKKMAGKDSALLVLFLFAFSPTLLAHGRLVTTDIGAALGAVIAIIFWLKFLENPSWKNVVLTGLIFGLAQLFKFTLLLLLPFFLIITVIYALFFKEKEISLGKNVLLYLSKTILISLIGFLFVIWPFYQFHILNYPPEQQLRDTISDISSNPIPFAKEITIWMAKQDFLRAPAQYFRGVLMAFQRSEWGNTTYFLGKISAKGFLNYFPVIYLFKEPLSLHLLTILAILLFFTTFLVRKKKTQSLKLTKENFWIFAIFLWILTYWLAAIRSNLNIGIRHLIPVLPFTYILVVLAIHQSFQFVSKRTLQGGISVLTTLLFLWYFSSSILSFPHYLSYYNEIGGGAKEGYKIAVDSNYDWGQDFYRLLKFIQENKIEKIYLDYFGGEEPSYWLKEKYIKFDPREIRNYPKGYLAVSANHLMGGMAIGTPDFNQETGYYNWLIGKNPISRAGQSIFIYYLD